MQTMKNEKICKTYKCLFEKTKKCAKKSCLEDFVQPFVIQGVFEYLLLISISFFSGKKYRINQKIPSKYYCMLYQPRLMEYCPT